MTSTDGGVGKSTLTAYLGGLLALALPDRPPYALDMSGLTWGGLTHRVARRNDCTVFDVHRHRHNLTAAAADDLAQTGPTGLHVFVTEPERTSARRPPSLIDLNGVVPDLRPHYPLGLLDLPAAVSRQVWELMLTAQASLLVARATVESVQHAMQLVTQLNRANLTDLASSLVVAVNETSPRPSRDVRAAEHQLAAQVAAVVRVPFDSTLAVAAPADPQRLRRPTRTSLVKLGAALIRQCNPTGNPTANAIKER